MLIGVDKAQQKGKHDLKHRMLINAGHQLVDMPVPVGDYIEITDPIMDVINRRKDKLKKMDTIGLISTSVDTKRDLSELYQCLVQGHARFSDSCLLAHNNGIRLVILVENEDGVKDLESFSRWKNEKRWKSYFYQKKLAEKYGKPVPKPPLSAVRLRQMMYTMREKYGTEFMFCNPQKTAETIVRILEGEM